jgi:hypothetical protein
VEVKRPGVWIFGSTVDDERQKEPWGYEAFGKTQVPPGPDGKIELVFWLTEANQCRPLEVGNAEARPMHQN